MNKFQQFKQALKNPPPDRLAKIEYQSHILQMVGITFVSVVLIYKGLWYIIFAFIFAVGINYSQAITTYKKYKNIQAFMPEEKPEEFEKDISPTRRRGKIIHYIFGDKVRWASIVISVILTYVLIGTDHKWWVLSLIYPVMILGLFTILYFLLVYKIAYYYYKRGMRK